MKSPAILKPGRLRWAAGKSAAYRSIIERGVIVMKKWITIYIVGVTLLCANIGFAQEYYNLSEIKGQAVDGWHEVYTDKYGRTIPVDISIDVYGNETAPIMKCDVPEFIDYDYNQGSPYDTVTNVAKKGGKRTHAYRSYGEKIDFDKAYGAQYGNDMTMREAYCFLKELLEVQGQGYLIDDFAFDSPCSFDVVYSKKVSNGEIHVPALYNIQLWQKINELPIMAMAEESVKNAKTRSYYPELLYQIRDKDAYSLFVRPLRAIEMIAEDIPLCSLERVIESVEREIKEGYIQKITALRFGYVVYSDPTILDWRKSKQEDEIFYLVPSWVVQCVFSENPKEFQDAEIDTLNIENDKYGEHLPLVNRIINAQTGKMFNYFEDTDGAYRGFISWEDIQ